MKRLLCFSLALFWPLLVAGQVQTGTPAFNSFGGGPFDSVNLGNLNVHFDVPIRHKEGRGLPFDYILTYDSSVWTPVLVGGVKTWQPAPNWGWSSNWGGNSGYLTYSVFTSYCYDGMGHQTGVTYYYQNWTYHDPWSNVGHSFAGQTIIYGGSCTGTSVYSFTSVGDSGLTLKVDLVGTNTVTTAAGVVLTPPINPPSGSVSTTKTDANGNQVTQGTTGNFTDTLNTTALTISGSSSPIQFSYTTAGSVVKSYSVNYSSFNVKTNFGCSGVGEYTASAVQLVSSISVPDGSSYGFTYETTPGNPSYVTGRLKQITLPTGGTIAYTYTGGNNGITCADGSTAGFQRAISPGGTWVYSRSLVSGAHWATTVTDPSPSQNQTVIDFQKDSAASNNNNDFFETRRLTYSGSATGTPLQTVLSCYNGNGIGTPSNCPTTTVLSPITRKTTFTYLPNSSGQQAEIDAYYNALSQTTRLDTYDFGAAAVGSRLRQIVTTYATYGSASVPKTVAINDGAGVTKASTVLDYDQTAVIPTSGTPQHIAVTGGRGNLTQVATQASGSITLYRRMTYYDTGNMSTATDPGLTTSGGANVTSYTYGGCSNSFPTSISEPLSLSRSMTWDCTGGVVTSQTDENGNPISLDYNHADLNGNTGDPFWRPKAVTDALGNTTVYTYQPNATYSSPFMVASSLAFGSSIVQTVSYMDGLGRPMDAQVLKGPGSTNLDTVSYTYDANGRNSAQSMPCITGYVGTCATNAFTQTYDALDRPLKTTDGGSGTLTLSYTKNDVLQTLGPATSGENTKQKQFEYDGLGRLTSVCEMTGASGGNCAQSSGSPGGYWTKYTYDALGNLTGVTQNAQAAGGSQQTRAYTYDMLGRLTSETNPESGYTTYAYDKLTSDTSCGTVSSAGDLVKKVDAVGNVTCFTYDGLHRVSTMSYPTGSYAGTMPKRYYVYDSATVNGTAMANAKTRLAEAFTCTTCPGTKITDLGFSYSARGELTDVHESTPHSVGYYHTTATYYPNGAINTLSGVPGQGTWTYGVDSQGRPASLVQGTTNILSSVAFNAAGQPTSITLPSGDSDSYDYDPNTGRMTKFTFTVGATPQSMVGNLYWNANGTLNKLAITDGFNSTGTQTCKYGDPTASVAGYDDLERLIKVDCGAAVWQQNFAYDAFGNVTKTIPTGGTGISWTPGYSSATNRYTLGGTSYDLDGNLLNDSFHTHAWNVEGKIVSIGTAACGTSGVICFTYDALGRVVERENGSAYTEFLYSPIGKTAVMTGQTLTSATITLPGGTRLYYATATNKQIWHKDWLGSVRLVSSFSARTIVADRSVAPFGEPYDVITGGGPGMFAENEQAIFAVSGSASQPYDTPYREMHPTQGRWLSPDPAGLVAVSLSVPQTWNGYAYVQNNPANATDPLGLFIYIKPPVDPWSGAGWTEGLPGGLCGAMPLLCAGLGLPRLPGDDDDDTGPPRLRHSAANNGKKPCTASTDTTSIISGNATTNAPTIPLGAAIGGAIGGPPGAFLGGIIGSFFGVGGTVSYVPSTKSWYAGGTVVFGLGVGGGTGVGVSDVMVPAGQNPNSIANGPSFSLTFQPNPFLGSTVVKSPGSGPPVVGPSGGTRIPVSGGFSYNFCLKNCGC